jgi:hypothetical protein
MADKDLPELPETDIDDRVGFCDECTQHAALVWHEEGGGYFCPQCWVKVDRRTSPADICRCGDRCVC